MAITTREFDTLKDSIVDFKSSVVETVSTGFDGVNGRLDTVNGRIGKHDDEIFKLLQVVARMGAEIADLTKDGNEMRQRESLREHRREMDREDHIHVHSRSSDPPTEMITLAPDDRPITVTELKRIAWIMSAALTVGGTAIGVILKYGPFILKVLEASNQGGQP